MIVFSRLLAQHPFLLSCTSPEQDVLHYATLLVFQSVTGGAPLLPKPMPQSPQADRDSEEAWSKLLLDAIRGDTSSEAEQALSNLQSEIKVIDALYLCSSATPRMPFVLLSRLMNVLDSR